MKNPNILKQLIKERTLVLDGAMGTMIQKYKFSEEDYRGNLFSDYNILLKGNNDLLSLTQPESILNIHREYLEYWRPILAGIRVCVWACFSLVVTFTMCCARSNTR